MFETPLSSAAGLAGRALLHRLSLVHSTVLLAYLGPLADAVAEVVEPGAPDGAGAGAAKTVAKMVGLTTMSATDIWIV